MSVNPPDLAIATQLELKVYQGKDITWEMTVVNTQDGEAVSIAGATIIFSVKSKAGDSSALFSRSVGSGIVIDPDQVANKGKFQLSLVPANTAPAILSPGTFQMDVEVTLSSKENTSARGTLEVLDVVTALQ